jgi:hypothetical protein
MAMIETLVGDRRRIVDFDLFLDVREELAEHFRAQGLVWPEFDAAIVAATAEKLAEILTFH